jgi:hypothetical protein
MAQFETWYFIKDGVLYKHYENDGHRAMNRGLEKEDMPICSVEEVKEKYPELLKLVENKNGLC